MKSMSSLQQLYANASMFKSSPLLSRLKVAAEYVHVEPKLEWAEHAPSVMCQIKPAVWRSSLLSCNGDSPRAPPGVSAAPRLKAYEAWGLSTQQLWRVRSRLYPLIKSIDQASIQLKKRRTRLKKKTCKSKPMTANQSIDWLIQPITISTKCFQ